MAKKFKILAASDTHGESALVKKLAEKAEKEKVDLVILCGDITGWSETQNILKPFKDKNKKVLLIPGNHESFATADFLANLYGMKNIHGYAVQYKEIGIFGAGGTTDFTAFKEHLSENELFKTLKQAHTSLKKAKKKIMVTHMHPYSMQSKLLDISASHAVTKAVKEFKPDFLLHGHIHETFGFQEKIGKTKVINVGREGKIIEI